MGSSLRNISSNPEAGDNPLDSVEEVLNANNWDFNRMTDEELVVSVNGTQCQYNLFFIWQDDFEALQFCCQYDLKIPADYKDKARSVLCDLNENLWLGHFEIMDQSTSPSFRHTCLFRGMKNQVTSESLQDLVDVAMAQCERHYPVFALLAGDYEVNDQTLNLAMMNTQGQS